MTAAMKTDKEIQDLFEQWKRDPVWDLWATDGFEGHKEQLEQMQKEQQELWAKQAAKKAMAYTEKIAGQSYLALKIQATELLDESTKLLGECDYSQMAPVIATQAQVKATLALAERAGDLLDLLSDLLSHIVAGR